MRSPVCPACGYDLRAQSTENGARCPECGRASAAEEIAPRTFRQAHIDPFLSRWFWLVAPAVVVPPIALLVMVWIGFDRWYIDPWPTWYEMSMNMLIVGGALLHITLGCACGRRMVRPWPWWACTLAGMAMIAIAVATFYLLAFTIVFLLGS